MANRTVRFFFSDIADAAEALLLTLHDMRSSGVYYSISGLTAESILQSGLTLTGEIDGVVAKLNQIPSAVSYE